MLPNNSTSEIGYVNGRGAVGPDAMSYKRRIGNALFVLAAFICFFCLPLVNAVAQSNQTSPLGTNLIELNYYTSDQPFLNIFKTGTTWAGQLSNGSRYVQSQGVIQLDSNGYPTSMSAVGSSAGQTFTDIDTLVLRGLGINGNAGPFYPAGTYVVLYDGRARSHIATTRSKIMPTTPGRDVLNVTPSAGGIRVNIAATDPQHAGNYIRNIRLVYAPTATNTVIDPNETLLANGKIFNPNFKAEYHRSRRCGL